MTTFLLTLLVVLAALILLVGLFAVAGLRHVVAAVEGVHLVADDIRTDLVADRNRNARWKG